MVSQLGTYENAYVTALPPICPILVVLLTITAPQRQNAIGREHMTATTDFMPATTAPAAPEAAPVQKLDGGRLMVRGSQSLLGAALMLSAAGLWIAPGSDWSADLLLIKLVVSLVIGFSGLALLQQGKTPAAPEVEVDVVRREVRLVRRTLRGDELVSRTKYEDLARAELNGAHLILWGQGDVMLAEIGLSDPSIRRSLVSGLSDAGKL